MFDHFRHAHRALIRGAKWNVDVSIIANKAIAKGLGFHVHAPTNFPDWSVTRKSGITPYGEPGSFVPLPDYVGDFESARSVAPAALELSLRERPDWWTAAYLTKDGIEAGKGDGSTPAHATVMAALDAQGWAVKVKGMTALDFTGPEPLIAGTDVEVYRIAALRKNMTLGEILNDYPGLTEAQVESACAYADSRPFAGAHYPAITAKTAMRKAHAGEFEPFADDPIASAERRV